MSVGWSCIKRSVRVFLYLATSNRGLEVYILPEHTMKGMVSAGQFYDVEQFKFYEHVKNSKEGWELTFNWLEDSECNPHTRFVGATIIHLKLQKSYRELEAETKPQVRSKLIELVVQYPLGSIQVSSICFLYICRLNPKL